MAISGKKLSELKNKVTDIKGNERIYVSDGSGTPKYIETNQLSVVDVMCDEILSMLSKMSNKANAGIKQS